MSKEYAYHDIANMFPMLSDEELQAQADDIKQNGLIHPILLFEDKILDGRNRYEACKIAGVEPRFAEFEGTLSEALERVWSENVHRRQLTSSQRAAIIVTQEELVSRIEAEARERQAETQMAGKDEFGNPITKSSVSQLIDSPKVDESTDVVVEDGIDCNASHNDFTSAPMSKPQQNRRRADSIIAQTANTNRQYINDAKKIKQSAPVVFDMVKTGDISIPEAKKVTNLDPETQTKVIEKIKTSPNVVVILAKNISGDISAPPSTVSILPSSSVSRYSPSKSVNHRSIG